MAIWFIAKLGFLTLANLLEGPAYSTVAGLALTSTNYEKAIDLLKVHIPSLRKFHPENPYGVKMLHAKYFQNKNCGFATIKLF